MRRRANHLLSHKGIAMSDTAIPFSSRLRLGRCAILCALALVLFGAVPSQGMTDIYQLAQRSNGVATDMTGSTQIFGPSASYTSSTTTFSIGFTFYFDKVAYTTFSANTSGLMSLGKATYLYPYCWYWPNLSTLSSYYPLIAAYWGYYAAPKATTGKVHYRLTGTAPNRVLTVEWKDVYTFNGTSTAYPGGTWQVRLYEGSNSIEFWYGDFYTSTSYYYYNIGIAQSTTRYINVWGNNLLTQNYLYPSGSYYSYRYPQNYPITKGTIFEFSPCDKNLTGLVGNLAEGGVSGMKSGSVLLENKEVMRGNTTGFRPFSFDLPVTPCQAWTYSVAFSGDAAGDYSIAPGNGTVITEGFAPTINFTPQGVGERRATMTITVSNGEKFTYNLHAEGVSRMGRIGTVAEGGTTGMSDGDILLANIDVPRNSSRDVRPFRITNVNTTPTAIGLANATVSFTLDDPNNQYSMRLETSSSGSGNSEKGSSVQAITSLSTVLSPGMSVTPVITFSPTPGGTERGTGPQLATLTVNADGEIFVYTLSGYSVAQAVEFFFNDNRVLGSNRRLFVNENTCVGEGAVSGSFVIENINKVPVTINSIDVLMTENVVRQGTPPYPQMLDLFGQPISMNDYFISENPSIAPVPANSLVQFPLTLQPGERKTYSLGFVAQRPGRRFSRAFLHTDAVNFVGKDVQGYMAGTIHQPETEEGILTLDLFGAGSGSHLAKDQEGNLKGLALLFNSVRVAQSITSEVWVHNSGDCDMRISQGDIRLLAGDVEDFELLDILPNTSVDAKGDFILAPGTSDKITARFTPSRSGSRRASVMLKTNDSTLAIDGISDRGIYTLDLFGVGRAFMEARPLRLAPAVVNGPGSVGVVEVFNASTETLIITAAELSGPGVAEITPDPSRPWPALPLMVAPGEHIHFGVLLNAVAGSVVGMKDATLTLTLKEGEPVHAQITGLIGTRTILANPSSLFRTAIVPLGGVKREYAVLTNTGTFPVRLERVSITGDGAVNYSLSILGRTDLDPGESQFVEVTYAPTIAGALSARIEIVSNATNGVQYIDLAGTATSTIPVGNPSSSGSVQVPGFGASRTVAGQTAAIASVVPNPARETATLSYSLPSEGAAEIALYDLSGRLVRTLHSGYAGAGEGAIQVDLANLAEGTYYITVRQNGEVARQPVVVVR